MFIITVMVVALSVDGIDYGPLSPEEKMILEWDGFSPALVSLEQVTDICDKVLKRKDLAKVHADFLIRQSDAYHYRNDASRAANAAKRALELRPADPEALWRIGRAKAKSTSKSDRGDALALAEALMKTHPRFAPGYYLAALCSLEMDSRRCISLCNTAIEIDPQFVTVYCLRAVGYFNVKDYEKCVKDVEKARIMEPVLAFSQSRLLELDAVALFGLRRFKRAEPLLAQVIGAERAKTEYYFFLWICYGESNKYGSALVVTSRLANLYPNESVAYWTKARSLAQLGLLEQAEKAAKKAIELAPNAHETLLTLGVISYLKGDYRQALVALTRASEIESVFWTDNGLWGSFMLSTCPDAKIRNGKVAKQVVQNCLKDLKTGQHRQTAMIVLALANAELGDFTEAEENLGSALIIDKENKEIACACGGLRSLFREKKAYRYDPLANRRPVFRLDPGRLIVTVPVR